MDWCKILLQIFQGLDIFLPTLPLEVTSQKQKAAPSSQALIAETQDAQNPKSKNPI